MRELTVGNRSREWEALQVAINKRLKQRDAEGRVIRADGQGGPLTVKALRYAVYLLGRDPDKAVVGGKVSVSIQETVRHPSSRTDAQKALGKKRVAKHRAAKAKAKAAAREASAERKRIVAAWKQAAANYRRNPNAYHYLAGGVANTEIMKPTPRGWRSDCSQFVAGGYLEAGVPSPAAPLAHQWAATTTIMNSPHVRITKNPKPGDLGMYGPPNATHHVEGYVGEPGCKFIGHGSPPIDSITPGEPDFYVTFDFLD